MLFAGITAGLTRQYGDRAFWMGLLLFAGAFLALVVTSLGRRRATSSDRPDEYLGRFYRLLEKDSGNWISRAVRHVQAFEKRGVMIHYVFIFTLLRGLPVLFVLATSRPSHLDLVALFQSQIFWVEAIRQYSAGGIMKAVILAAGQGTRIRSVHGERPKCLIEAFSGTILDHQLEALSMAGINDVAIVVGYEKEQIMAHVRNHYSRSHQRVQFVENSVFALTNNIYSLWLALEWLRGDSFMVLNADVIFDPEILQSAIRPSAPISMIVDPCWRDETMKVVVSGDRVVQMSKKINRDKFSGTYIGITVFNRAIFDKFASKIKHIISGGQVNVFFNVAVQELADEGLQVGFSSTNELPWAEIDDPQDLIFAQQSVFPQLVARAF